MFNESLGLTLHVPMWMNITGGYALPLPMPFFPCLTYFLGILTKATSFKGLWVRWWPQYPTPRPKTWKPCILQLWCCYDKCKFSKPFCISCPVKTWRITLNALKPGFHQCPSPLNVLYHVVRRLKIGGTLLILDYVPIQDYTVTNQYQRCGFMMAELHNMLEHQGLADVEVVPLTDSRGNIILDSSGQRQIVIAKGVKPGILVWNTY